MEALITLQNDTMRLQAKITGEDHLEQQLYSLLIAVNQEIVTTLEKAIAFRKDMTFHKALDEILEEVSTALEGLHEIYESSFSRPFNTLSLKRLFEALDEEMGMIDNFIESFNELFETNDITLDYIESWDIAFFIENM